MDNRTREFLLESQESLDGMHGGVTELESRPADAELLAAIFTQSPRLAPLRDSPAAAEAGPPRNEPAASPAPEEPELDFASRRTDAASFPRPRAALECLAKFQRP